MKLIEVEEDKTIRLFHKVVEHIYRSDENFVYPLINDVELSFSKSKNKRLQNGVARRWVLLDEKKRPIGRIAAFMPNNSESQDCKGIIGFFECIDSEDAAFLLLNCVHQWFKDKGIRCIEGPLDFGEYDRFWGMMAEGFSTPTYLESYNPAYYNRFFENYGFFKKDEKKTYRISRQSFDAKRFIRTAEWISRKPGFRFEHFQQTKRDKQIEDFTAIYNQTWALKSGFEPMTLEKVKKLLNLMRHILVDDFIWFAYYQDKPVGVMVMIPDINQVLSNVKGHLKGLSWLKFLWYKQTTSINRIKGLVFGVLPEYRKYGIETVLIYKFYKVVSADWLYNSVEISLAKNLDKRMGPLLENINAHVSKRHLLYQFDIKHK